FEPRAIRDEELRMMFSCCHPRLAESGQIALILQLVCGFGIAEISGAFLLPAETIKKRLQRSRKVLAASKNLFDIGDAPRLPARVDESGRLTLLVDQDRSRWDRDLIAQGKRLLDLSATGDDVSEYHVEAAIAFIHVEAPSFEATKWDAIVELYDRLLAIRP